MQWDNRKTPVDQLQVQHTRTQKLERLTRKIKSCPKLCYNTGSLRTAHFFFSPAGRGGWVVGLRLYFKKIYQISSKALSYSNDNDSPSPTHLYSVIDDWSPLHPSLKTMWFFPRTWVSFLVQVGNYNVWKNQIGPNEVIWSNSAKYHVLNCLKTLKVSKSKYFVSAYPKKQS